MMSPWLRPSTRLKTWILPIGPSTRIFLRTCLTVSEPWPSLIYITKSFLLHIQLVSKRHSPQGTQRAQGLSKMSRVAQTVSTLYGFDNFNARQLQRCWTDFSLCGGACLVNPQIPPTGSKDSAQALILRNCVESLLTTLAFLRSW